MSSQFSKLGGIKINVTAIAPFIERRVATVDFERSKTKTFSVVRGHRGLRVRAKMFTQADYESLLSLFDTTGTGSVQFDSLQRTQYTNTYVLGDLDADDITHFSTNVELSFTLFEDPNVTAGAGEEALGIGGPEVGLFEVGIS